MVSTIEIDNGQGGTVLIPAVWLIVNDYQQFVVLDHEDQSVISKEPSVSDGVESDFYSKLSDCGYLMNCRIGNSLTQQGWDFDKYPDPLIFILTRLTSN